MNKYIIGAGILLAGFMAVPALAQTADDYGIAAPGAYCPALSVTIQRGARDISTNNQVSELQKFLADYYNFDPVELVTGYFGYITQGYVQRFQREQGLPTFGIAGQLTRAAIMRVCNQTSSGQTNTTSTQANTTSNTTSTVAGCVPGARFSSTTGRACDHASTVAGCVTGALFSSTTGRPCSGTQQPQPTQPTTPTAPTDVRSLTVTNVSGTQITAQYVNMPAAGVYVRNIYGTVVWTQELGSGSGTIVITLPTSVVAGTYVLNAFGSDGTIYANSAQFTYAPQGPTPSCTLSSSSQTIVLGQSSTLSWSSQNATNVSLALNEGKGNAPTIIGGLGASGTQDVVPNWVGTSAEVLNVSGPGGSGTCSATLNVESASIDGNPLTISNSTPTLTGIAYTTNGLVGIVLGNNGGKVYGSGTIAENGTTWSIITSWLDSGTYTIYVYDSNNLLLTTGILTIPPKG